MLVRVERSGRSLRRSRRGSSRTARLVALALATFARSREALEFQDLHMPEVAPPETLARARAGCTDAPCRCARASTRGPRSERPSPARALARDQRRLAAPGRAVRARRAGARDVLRRLAADRSRSARTSAPDGLRGVPTVDLTVHFRAPIPPDARPDDFYLCVFRSQTARDGFLEEDGEIWTRDGVLLAQSRQLAMLI